MLLSRIYDSRYTYFAYFDLYISHILTLFGYNIEMGGIILIKMDIYKTVTPGTFLKKNLKRKSMEICNLNFPYNQQSKTERLNDLFIYLIFITSSWLKNIHIIKEQDIYNLNRKMKILIIEIEKRKNI